jgi:N-acetylmuramoyl-L-alanine amidase
MTWKRAWMVAVGVTLALSAAGPAAATDSMLSVGSSGQRVATLQRALEHAGYLTGAIDGHYGDETEQAVIAFEKTNGLLRDGAVSAHEYQEIVHATRPAPPLRISGRYVYVDLARQVLFEVRDGVVTHILPVSSGGGYTYYDHGEARVATTPTGRFSIYAKITGWRHSSLGWMYYPSYFSGGYAIHGDTYVPADPVSHGCIRIPMWDAIPFFDRNPVGTTVFVEH